jgi:uncharacterized protein YoxC
MAFSIGGLLRTPSDLPAAVRSVLGWTDEAVQVVADLPVRVAALVAEAERLVDRAGAVLDRVEAAVTRVDGVVGEVDALVGRVGEVTESAAGVADRAGEVAGEVGATGRGAQELLDLYRPVAERGAPRMRRFVDEFSEEEMTALVRLVDQVPRFTEHMESDIMPVLAKLDQVGPDVHELLDVLKDVRLAIQGVPGFALFRRRGADKEDELADERPDTPRGRD